MAYQHHGVASEPDPVVIRRAASFAVRDGHGPTGELHERSSAPAAADRGRARLGKTHFVRGHKTR